MRREAAIALAVSLVAAGCASATPARVDPDALASGAAVKTLDAGKLDSLPTGGVFVRVIEFDQPPLYTIKSRQHVAGFVFVERGVHRLTIEGSAPVDILAGSARFHPSISHTHFNPGPGSSVWYFIAVWPSSSRGQPAVDPIAKPDFQSDNIPPGKLPPGVYSEVLRQVTIAPSGRSEAHRFGGMCLFFVLDGALNIETVHGAVKLNANQGAVYGSGTALQELNKGSDVVTYLEMLTTAPGSDFEVPLSSAPAG